MIPDYLIIDEIRRRRERAWEPEPLHLPIYVPECPDTPRDENTNTQKDSDKNNNGVIIIDLNNYTRII